MPESQTLYDDVSKLLADGKEEELRQYVIEHLKEFPEETQRQLVVSVLSEAMEENLSARERAVELKRQILEMLETFERQSEEEAR